MTSKINVFEVDETKISSVLCGYEEQTWFKSKDNHDTALSQLQNIYRTIEERDASTTVHRASLSCQACNDAIIKKIQRSLDDYLIKNPTSQLTMKDLLEDVF